MDKSCTTCPSYLTPGEAANRFGKNPGATMCGRFGYVLNRPMGDTSDDIQAYISFAENCASHGEPLPGTPVKISPRVAEPSDEIINAGPTSMTVASCHGCQNCVKHTAMQEAHGWLLPMCKAKGTLIMSPTNEAKDCPWGRPGPSTSTLMDVDLVKEFRTGFVVNEDAAFHAVIGNGNLHADPRNYETDAEVSAEDRAEGIRAWRKLVCPNGTGQEIFLPIFDHTENGILTEFERTQIPQAEGDHHPEIYVDYGNLVWKFAVEGWTLDQTLFIQSFPGLGKTEFVYHLGWLMQLPVTRFYFQRSTEWEDVFGKVGYSPDRGTFFMDGRFTAGFRRPGLILCDEPNMATGELVATLRTTTEVASTLFLDAAYGETEEERIKLEVRPHRYNFRVWAANPAWDPRNLGTNELAAADISRLSPAYLDYPPTLIEREIIKSAVLELDGWEIPDDLLDDILKVSDDIREAANPENGDFPGTWGIRENVKVARKARWYPFVEAYRMANLNYYEPQVAAWIIDNSIKTIRPDDVRR